MIFKNLNIIDRMKESKVPGVSFSVIDQGQIVLSRAYGVLDSNSSDKVNVDSLFHACSMSKFVTTLAVLRLVSLGILHLDEDINNRLRSWKIYPNSFVEERKVTLRLLLSHQGGIRDKEGSFAPYNPLEGYPQLIDILDGKTSYHSSKVEVKYKPGSNFEYSDAGFCIIEQLLVDVMEKPFSELMNALVLESLEMHNSLFMYPPDNKTKFTLARGHDKNGKAIEVNKTIYPYLAAAGFLTTPTDLCKLILEVILGLGGNSKLGINKQVMENLISPQGNFEDAGLGVFITKTSEYIQITSQGWGVGFQCMLAALPVSGKAAVVMINSEPGKPQHNSLVGEIMRAISTEYNWPTKIEFFS
ncbi:serine hydrolase domain-containing protein [Alkaliphilus transvaalensis]|uniref:serine hydrolase domain-containing protein n=1 Tax=Alkaliphilus transvaalensis TaxID=114628 RepID=UPI0006888568|nr:serine hydrolase domain-containing protein [Alkaliphilus transvaalensis]